MPLSSSMLSTMFPVFLGLMGFLLAHMTFYMFSYSSLLFSLVVIYTAVFCIHFDKEVYLALVYLKNRLSKNFMNGGFAPFNTSGWSNVVTDDNGNIIDSEYEDDEEDDLDATDNIISRKRNRRKPPDDGVLIESNETDECMEADSEDNEKSKCV